MSGDTRHIEIVRAIETVAEAVDNAKPVSEYDMDDIRDNFRSIREQILRSEDKIHQLRSRVWRLENPNADEPIPF